MAGEMLQTQDEGYPNVDLQGQLSKDPSADRYQIPILTIQQVKNFLRISPSSKFVNDLIEPLPIIRWVPQEVSNLFYYHLPRFAVSPPYPFLSLMATGRRHPIPSIHLRRSTANASLLKSGIL